MAKKRYYYVKLDENFLDDVNIKRLRKIAGGAEYVIVFLKMILKTIKTDGVVEVIDGADMVEEMALLLDEPKENVRFVLQYLQTYGLIEVHEMSVVVNYALENVGTESDSAKRVREFRQRQKALQCNVLQCNDDCNEKCNANCNDIVNKSEDDMSEIHNTLQCNAICNNPVTIYRYRNKQESEQDLNKYLEPESQTTIVNNSINNSIEKDQTNVIIDKMKTYGVKITTKIKEALEKRSAERLENNIKAAEGYLQRNITANAAGVVAQAIADDWGAHTHTHKDDIDVDDIDIRF